MATLFWCISCVQFQGGNKKCLGGSSLNVKGVYCRALSLLVVQVVATSPHHLVVVLSGFITIYAFAFAMGMPPNISVHKRCLNDAMKGRMECAVSYTAQYCSYCMLGLQWQIRKPIRHWFLVKFEMSVSLYWYSLHLHSRYVYDSHGETL